MAGSGDGHLLVSDDQDGWVKHRWTIDSSKYSSVFYLISIKYVHRSPNNLSNIYSARRKNEVLIEATTWMHFRNVFIERSQTKTTPIGWFYL